VVRRTTNLLVIGSLLVVSGCAIHEPLVKTHHWNDFTVNFHVRSYEQIKLICENVTGLRNREGCAYWITDSKKVDIWIPELKQGHIEHWKEIVSYEVRHAHHGVFHK